MSTFHDEKRAFPVVALLMLLLWGTAQAYALDLPSRQEIRSRILKKLDEIREESPRAKARAKWLKLLNDANATLKEAIIQGVPHYIPDDWDHSLWLCGLSMKYGRRREYRKADYLARLCKESGEKAIEKAQGIRKKRTARCREELDSLYALLKRAERRQSIARVEADKIRLRLRDLENALALEQFDVVEKGIAEIGPHLRKLASKQEIWGL